MTWRYLTPERTQMRRWTRKRRLKFRKRWRKQHGGANFRWFKSETRYVTTPFVETKMIILHQRDP